jgi:glyoxylase-like metal-dependent hydrolase (beta-lactamase superfamily II)
MRPKQDGGDMLTAILLALLQGGEPPEGPAAPPPQEVAAGTTLIPGAILPGLGPDGNTIIYDAPRGLIVVDTGRHVWQSDAILAFARARHRRIAAIVNTHWHLDHSSGNARIKAAFPRAPLYATNAIDRALRADGFLGRGLARARQRLAETDVPANERSETQIFIDTMAVSDSLRPDVTLTESGRLRIAGRRFDAHVTQGAVSDADVWLYDASTQVAVLGDLVTFPAPFFETACPNQWRAELDAVWATPFRIAIPGHGAPMTRAQFDLYRQAYGGFIDCVNSQAQASACASAWASAIAPLASVGQTAQASDYADYYVGYLRNNGSKSPTCLRN